MFIFVCLLSLCVCVSFSSELCSLHHWRWKCYFDRCIKVPGQGLCRCVLLWLAPNTIVFFFLIASRDCVCFWWNPFIVCVHVNIYWQLALITCQSHSSLPQGPITHKERWFVVTQVCTSLDFLFVFAPKKKERYIVVTAIAWGIWSTPFALTQNWSLTLWAVWENPEGLLFSQLYVDIFQWQYQTKQHVIPHKCSPPLIWNKMSP